MSDGASRAFPYSVATQAVTATPRRYQPAPDELRRAVPDKHGAEHVRRRVPQLIKREDLAALSRSGNVLRNAAEAVPRQLPQQYLAGAAQMIRTAPTGGIVQHDDIIRHGRRRQTALDRLPWRQPVAETDDGKVVGERRAQECRAAARRRQAGDHLDLRPLGFAPQLTDQGCHPVDAAVAGADESGGLALPRLVQRHAAALRLLRHGRGPELLVRIERPHQVHVDLITQDDIRLPQRPIRPQRHIVPISGADSNDIQLTQSAPPCAPPPGPQSRRSSRSFARSAAPRPAAPPARRHCPHRQRSPQRPTA